MFTEICLHGQSFYQWLFPSTSSPNICDLLNGTEVHVIPSMYLVYTVNQLKIHDKKINTETFWQSSENN